MLGERYRWRVRAINAGMPGEWSAPVDGTTQGLIGPLDHLTPFEQSGGARFTTHEEEGAYLKAIDAASKRVRVDQVGTTHLGRPIYLATIGHPRPRARRTSPRGTPW